MRKILLAILSLLYCYSTLSQNLTGDYYYPKSGIDYVAIHLKLNNDSTFHYKWTGDLYSYYSFGKYRIENDTLYLTSLYKDHIKSVKSSIRGENCMYIHLNNFEQLGFGLIKAIVYYKSRPPLSVDLLEDVAILGKPCRYSLGYSEEANFNQMDSIVFKDFIGNIGTISSASLTGNDITIELLGRDYHVFENKKYLIKNKRKIYLLHKNKRGVLLKKTNCGF
jgi:hypothetical protein